MKEEGKEGKGDGCLRCGYTVLVFRFFFLVHILGLFVLLFHYRFFFSFSG